MPLLQHATFVTSATAAPHLPLDSELEVAVAGRSNAGKSSAINALAGRRRLAFVSKTPGRTQEINYFRIVDGKYLVDLPGYGYAKVPVNIKKRWEAFLGEFLRLRPQLAGLIVIMDVRHPVTELDLRLLDWFAPTGKPVHVLLTKSDKLTRQESAKTLAQVRRFLDDHYPGYTAQLFSSVNRNGVDTAEEVIAGWLQLNTNKKPPVKGE